MHQSLTVNDLKRLPIHKGRDRALPKFDERIVAAAETGDTVVIQYEVTNKREQGTRTIVLKINARGGLDLEHELDARMPIAGHHDTESTDRALNCTGAYFHYVPRDEMDERYRTVGK